MLFDTGIPEAVIQKRTGHKSVDALRCYEQITMSQNEQVSSVLEQARSLLKDSPEFTLNPEEFQQFVNDD